MWIEDAVKVPADHDSFVGPFGGDLVEEVGVKDGASVVARIGWAVDAHDVEGMVAEREGDGRGTSRDEFGENRRGCVLWKKGGFDQDGYAASGSVQVGKVPVEGEGAVDPPAGLGVR
jgi:hypothetical protein